MNNEREALTMKCSCPCALCLYMTKRIDKALEEMNLPLSLFAGGRTEKIRAAGAGPVDFDTLLAQSDFLSCHCPLTPATRHWIDRRALAKMKRSACLINTSRGGLICEADLILVMDRGRIIAQGTHQELMEHCEMYHEIYQSQQEGVSIGG